MFAAIREKLNDFWDWRQEAREREDSHKAGWLCRKFLLKAGKKIPACKSVFDNAAFNEKHPLYEWHLNTWAFSNTEWYPEGEMMDEFLEEQITAAETMLTMLKNSVPRQEFLCVMSGKMHNPRMIAAFKERKAENLVTLCNIIT